MAEDNTTKQDKASNVREKLVDLPMARVRHLIKLDEDMNMNVPNDTVFAITQATESFIASIALEAYSRIQHSKKKTIQKSEVKAIISSIENLIFLSGCLDAPEDIRNSIFIQKQ